MTAGRTARRFGFSRNRPPPTSAATAAAPRDTVIRSICFFPFCCYISVALSRLLFFCGLFHDNFSSSGVLLLISTLSDISPLLLFVTLCTCSRLYKTPACFTAIASFPSRNALFFSDLRYFFQQDFTIFSRLSHFIVACFTDDFHSLSCY